MEADVRSRVLTIVPLHRQARNHGFTIFYKHRFAVLITFVQGGQDQNFINHQTPDNNIMLIYDEFD